MSDIMNEVNGALKELRAEVEKKSVDQEKVEKLHSILDQHEEKNQELIKQIGEQKAAKEELEAKFNELEAELKRGSLAGEAKEEKSAELKSFEAFIASGKDGYNALAAEAKTLRTDNNVSGGYLAPSEYVNEIIKKITEVSPVRSVARVINSNAKEVEIPKRNTKVSGGWVGEASTADASNSTYDLEKIPVNKMMVYTDISIEMAQDAAFNMRQEISSDVAEDFAQIEGAAFVNGDAVKKPEGLLTNSEVSTYNTGDANLITADSLFEIQGEIKTGYNLTWMLNRRTLNQHIRTLKDGNGQYLLQMGLGSLPSTIAGVPYVLANDMPDVAAGTKPVIIGDYRKAYYIIDSAQLTVLEDPYTQATSGLRRFIFNKRVGGQVVLPEALKILQVAA